MKSDLTRINYDYGFFSVSISATLSRNGASTLATSTMKTEAQTDRKAFVTLRFAGDDLDPREISAILPVAPTRARRKGEVFGAGPYAGTLRGPSGISFLATDKLVPSDDFGDHLAFVHDLLYPELAVLYHI